ncbi:MAG: hypothetical protein JWO80_1705 [Bryobacterales bacterium]|nr:hypothetical protein [Bryobacterales bacterium]
MRHALRGFLFLLPALSSAANSVPKLSLQALVSQSEIIVSGTVTRSWTGWDSEHRFIWTHTEIRPGGFLKGKSQSMVTVSEPGGSADGLTHSCPVIS